MKPTKEQAKKALLRSIASLTPKWRRCEACFGLEGNGPRCIRRHGHRGRHLTRTGQLWKTSEATEATGNAKPDLAA
jgi:hypothetical protein